MRALLKRKEYDMILQKSFNELSILEIQLHAGEAKSYDLWLWEDNLNRIEQHMVNDIYAKMLFERYQSSKVLFEKKILLKQE